MTISHPPVSLLHAANPFVRRLLRTSLPGRLRDQVMVIDFTGRKTGRRYSLPLSAHQIDGVLYAMTSAPVEEQLPRRRRRARPAQRSGDGDAR